LLPLNPNVSVAKYRTDKETGHYSVNEHVHVAITIYLSLAQLFDTLCYKQINIICFAGYSVSSLTLGLMTRFAVTVAYYTTVQRRWEIISIFDKISTASTESPMALAVAIVPSIIYMVRKSHIILIEHMYVLILKIYLYSVRIKSILFSIVNSKNSATKVMTIFISAPA
jgi:hypothetical protein